MSFGDVGKSFERRCTNNGLEQDRVIAGPQKKHPGYAFYESFRATNDIWQRLDARMSKGSNDEKAACARAWLSAHLERKLFFRVELLLITVRERADTAACSSESATARCDGLLQLDRCYSLLSLYACLYTGLAGFDALVFRICGG